MKGQSNSLVVFLAVLAIISLSISFFVHNLQNDKITGLVVGTVNVTINSSTGISLSRAAINFTVSNPGTNRVTYLNTDLTSAPLGAGGCSSRLSHTTCGINVTNDGNVNVNITLQDSGAAIFKSGTFSRVRHFLFNVSVPYSSRFVICANNGAGTNGFYHINNTEWSGTQLGGFVPTINWTPVNASAITIVCGLNYTDSGPANEPIPDTAAIEINITVPSDEAAGTKGTTLEILGIAS